jgi:uncharacterized membrane protein
MLRPAFVLRLLLLALLGWMLAKLGEFQPSAKTFLAAAPPIIICLALAVLFGRSLYRGEALVTRIARREQDDGLLPDELVIYTRRLTGVWAVFLIGCALCTVILVQYTDAWYIASLAPTLSACFMICEYVFRKWRYRQYPHKNPVATMLLLMQRGFPTD